MAKGGRGNRTAAALHSTQERSLILKQKEREAKNNMYTESSDHI